MPDGPIEAILERSRDQMRKAFDHLRLELSHIRTGRATPAMLDGVKVDYYGTQTPLDQVASVSAPAADLLIVQPYDPSSLESIEKAIMTADLGLNPNDDGAIIRVPVPPLSQERRQELAQTVGERGEKTRISIRNIRRSAREEMKKTQEEQNLSEDLYYASEEELQEITDDAVSQVDELVERKEDELMQV